MKKFGIAIEKSVPTDDYGYDARIERTQVWVGDRMPQDQEINETVLAMDGQEATRVVIEQQRKLRLGWRVVQQIDLGSNTIK
jgi:hypothetical protein